MNDEALDRAVRDALKPDAAVVERVVRGATLHARPPRPARRLLLVAAGTVAVVAVGALLMDRTTPGKPPETIRLTNIDDTIVVTPASGAVWLVGSRGSHVDRLPAGTIVVHRSGARR
jgi:hypothetical protein